MQHKKPDIFRRLLCLLLCAAVLCGSAAFPFGALASGGASPITAPSIQPTPDTYYTGDLFCPYNYNGLSGRVAHCIESIVIRAATNFLESFLPFYEAVVIASMVLAVTIYGVMVSLGTVIRPTGQTFAFIIKLGAVAFFTLQFGGMVEQIFSVMKGLLQIVTNYVTVSTLSACSDEGHLATFFGGGFQRENLTVWDRVDCLFITLLGITVAQTTMFGIVALLAKVMVTGGVGIIIFVAALFFMFTLLRAVILALKMYLACVIAIAFLVVISPMVIPMALFSQTRPAFDKWLKNLTNYMLTPMFLFAYLAMIVAAYDAILFKGTSSLYYAIASEASQEKGFNFRDWLAFGASGEVARDADGKVQLDGSGQPILISGSFVGKDIPGLDAIAIATFIETCNSADSYERGMLGENCESDGLERLETMLECALNPVVPRDGEVLTVAEGGGCESIEGGRPYYGFLRNEELFSFAIAPNISTDADVRKKRNEKCNILCKIGRGVGAVVGFAFNVVKQVVGAIWRFGGWLQQMIGKGIKAFGVFVQGACNMGTLTPGAVCDAVGGVFQVAGTVVHAVGTIANFSGRVLMNGLAAELKEMFEGWFDVETIDFQKIASYRCSVELGISDPRDPRYINECPGPEDIIIDILYVMLTAAVVAYLMLRWLSYIPSLGSTLIGNARLEVSLPGDRQATAVTGKMRHGIERMLSKRK